jgi:alkylation response protein AidB-like acyl-CoA dehydrogenase
MSTPTTYLLTSVLRAPLDFATGVAREARDEDEAEVLSELLHVVRRFCRAHVDGAAIDARGSLGPDLLAGIGELGWFGLTIPAEYGGAGLSVKAATRVVTELAAFNGSLGVCVGLHSGLGLYSLLHYGNAELKQRYLPEIAAGERITSFAATEPSAGSDLTAMRTTLSERDGRLWLNGSKCYVTNGGVCGLVTVVARSPGLGGARAGHTMVAVDPSWGGVHRQGEEKKLGLKGSSTLTLDFDEVEIPRDHVIGQLAQGMDHAHQALTWGRTFMAAGCLGSARAALEEGRAHTAERVQFGRPLAEFPLVREQTAGVLADTYASESIIRLVCDLYEAKQGDIGLDSAIAKIFGSESAWEVVDRCLQLMGGVGYIEEAGMARRLRDVRVTRIFEGANDVLRLHLASAVLSWPSEELAELPPLAPHVVAPLAEAASRFDAVAHELGVTLLEIRKRLAFRLFQRQVVQALMADAIIAVYGMLAVLLRALGRAKKSGCSEVGLALPELACRRLEGRARRALDLLRVSEDPGLGRLVDDALSESED